MMKDNTLECNNYGNEVGLVFAGVSQVRPLQTQVPPHYLIAGYNLLTKELGCLKTPATSYVLKYYSNCWITSGCGYEIPMLI